ncbi:MAG TPA: ion channel [Candidatus Binatia bacterium]|nr:ion channel [Candidatus Binatia bacterium]
MDESEKLRTKKADRRALLLLLSLLFLFLISPFAGEGPKGEILFLLALYWTFVVATRELIDRPAMRWPPLILAVISLCGTLFAIHSPVRGFMAFNWALMAGFFGSVCVIMFLHLGRSGPITSGRLYVSVSLYFLLGIFYFAVFNFLDSLVPGSFVTSALPAGTRLNPYSHLYFSMTTLTTLGYGDIVPATPMARMLSVLEAATGVLYIAITVARLVAAYQSEDSA